MNTLVTSAIVGTGQLQQVQLTTETPLDALIEQLPETENERKLLLAAGALHTYQRAGTLAVEAPEPPTPADAEQLPYCSNTVALLLQKFLSGDQQSLLPETLIGMQRISCLLPLHLLSQALDEGSQKKALRPLLAPVIGERGRWLSQFKTSWAWVDEYVREAQAGVTADLERVWQEGSVSQRATVLQQLRRADAEQARQWTEQVWKQEAAEARLAFLTTFEERLSTADEAFLEQCLNDRSSLVRSKAAELLLQLPDSALRQRMQARAEQILTYAGSTLQITLPKEPDEQWKRDGLEKPAEKDQGARAALLVQILAHTPPSFWEERFGSNAEGLLASLQGNEWEETVLIGWSRAAVRFSSLHWSSLLWQTWLQRATNEHFKSDMQELHASLLEVIPQSEGEKLVTEHLRKVAIRWKLHLLSLPKPWSPAFSQVVLQTFRDDVHSITKDTQFNNTNFDYEWLNTLPELASALSPDSFAQAREPWELPQEKTWQVRYWERAIQEFTQAIQTRQKLQKEFYS